MVIKKTEDKIRGSFDYIEIQNMMSRYEYLLTAGLYQEIVDMFAKKTPGVKAEMDWGVYNGNEGIQKLYLGIHSCGGDESRIGRMTILPVSNPIIEVAGDRKTAKGLWHATGVETHLMEGKPQAYWAWCKYGVDFVKEDSKWKFWHLQVYGVVYSPYEKGWAEICEHPKMILSDELKPDKPPTYHWMYNTGVKYELIPPPPEPYETWDGNSMTTQVD